jgi:hypothetical protein
MLLWALHCLWRHFKQVPTFALLFGHLKYAVGQITKLNVPNREPIKVWHNYMGGQKNIYSNIIRKYQLKQ